MTVQDDTLKMYIKTVVKANNPLPPNEIRYAIITLMLDSFPHLKGRIRRFLRSR